MPMYFSFLTLIGIDVSSTASSGINKCGSYTASKLLLLCLSPLNKMIGILINCIAGIFLVLTGGLVIVLVLTIQQQQRHRPRRKIQVAMTDTRANNLCLKT